MDIRVVSSELYNNLLFALQSDLQSESTAVQQASSGKSVNSLSDNPLAAGQLVLNRTEIENVDQFTSNVNSLQGSLQTADSALNAIVGSLSQAIATGTEAGGGALTGSELNALGSEVDNLKQQIFGLANTSYQGTYIFAGSAVTTAPYVLTASSLSGVQYVGNNEVNSADVGEGLSISTNVPGSSIFNGQGADVFQSLTDLSNAIQANNSTGITNAIGEVQSAFNNVVSQRTFYGNTLQQLQSDSTNLSQQQLTLQQVQNGLIGANPAQVAVDLSQAQTALEAAIAAGSQISQDSLIFHLPVG